MHGDVKLFVISTFSLLRADDSWWKSPYITFRLCCGAVTFFVRLFCHWFPHIARCQHTEKIMTRNVTKFPLILAYHIEFLESCGYLRAHSLMESRSFGFENNESPILAVKRFSWFIILIDNRSRWNDTPREFDDSIKSKSDLKSPPKGQSMGEENRDFTRKIKVASRKVFVGSLII